MGKSCMICLDGDGVASSSLHGPKLSLEGHAPRRRSLDGRDGHHAVGEDATGHPLAPSQFLRRRRPATPAREEAARDATRHAIRRDTDSLNSANFVPRF